MLESSVLNWDISDVPNTINIPNAENSCSSTWISMLTEGNTSVFVTIIALASKFSGEKRACGVVSGESGSLSSVNALIRLKKTTTTKTVALIDKELFLYGENSTIGFCDFVCPQCNIFRVTGNSVFV